MTMPDQDSNQLNGRISRLRASVQESQPAVCPERALLWTEYFKQRKNRKKPVPIQMAEALRHVLLNKSIAIYPDELLIGNYTSNRVGGGIFPELHGLQVLSEIGGFPSRRVNPMSINPGNIKKLRKIIPFWLFRNIAFLSYSSPLRLIPFLRRQLHPRYYMILELGGIVHFAPDYETIIRIGSDGLAAQAEERQKQTEPNSEEWNFCEAVRISAGTLALFGERYAALAEKMALVENDPQRREELREITRICRQVPRKPARNYHEALQSVLLTHIAINHESLDVTICFGRMDQYLYEFYERDLARGIIDRDKAKELLSCFSIKLCETTPVFSRLITRFIGGLPSYQTLVVGGVDKNGKDAVNELSYIFLEIMNELRMRQPNFHARIHGGSPEKYLNAVYSALAHGGNFLAVYNDDIIVPTMVKYGYSLQDARDYAPIGCVEPTSQGRSFASTDAVVKCAPDD
jgi:pyruvate-formate lyase